MDKTQLHNLYVKEKMTTQAVADLLGVSRCKITYWLNKHGIKIRKRGHHRIGKRSHNWKGGRTINGAGYVMVWTGECYVQEHRLVMEKHLGRKLSKHEVVHHKNRDRQDNRIDNLELCSDQTEHMLHYAPTDEPETDRGRRLKELFLSGKTWDEIAKEID